jgi:hypothetical protein
MVVRDVSGALHDLRKLLVYLKGEVDQAIAKLDVGLESCGLVDFLQEVVSFEVRPHMQVRAQHFFKPPVVNQSLLSMPQKEHVLNGKTHPTSHQVRSSVKPTSQWVAKSWVGARLGADTSSVGTSSSGVGSSASPVASKATVMQLSDKWKGVLEDDRVNYVAGGTLSKASPEVAQLHCFEQPSI